MKRSQELQDFMAAASPVAVNALAALLDHAMDAWKEKLVSAEAADVPKIQGGVVAYRALRAAIQSPNQRGGSTQAGGSYFDL
jgi:hypothetical protein